MREPEVLATGCGKPPAPAGKPTGNGRSDDVPVACDLWDVSGGGR